jgi:hypothetical protein
MMLVEPKTHRHRRPRVLAGRGARPVAKRRQCRARLAQTIRRHQDVEVENLAQRRVGVDGSTSAAPFNSSAGMPRASSASTTRRRAEVMNMLRAALARYTRSKALWTAAGASRVGCR